MKNADDLLLNMFKHSDVTAIILAGGLGKRLNNKNKGLVALSGKTLLERVIERIKVQTQCIVINANKDLSHYQATGYPVIKDQFENYQGPLAGILSCQAEITTPLVLTVPCDAPMLPKNLLNKMLLSYNKNITSQLCVVHDGQRLQNLFMLFNIEKMEALSDFFCAGNRKVGDWINTQPHTIVDFSKQKTEFININTESTLNALRDQIKANEH